MVLHLACILLSVQKSCSSAQLFALRQISVVQRQFLFGLLPSASPKTADSPYDWEPAGRRVTDNGLLLLYYWWQNLCPSRLPVRHHIVSGRPLPLKDLFFWNCQEMSYWTFPWCCSPLGDFLFTIIGPAPCPTAVSYLWPNLQEKRRC